MGQILADEMGVQPSRVPQLWALFTEVQKLYEHGLRPPDDVTLLWTDDNTGNLRRLPTPEERKRRGGAGIYYHFDMHGGPYAYQWINTNPLPKIWEQMNLALEYYLPRGGDHTVILMLGPVMDFVPDRGMRVAVSFDDQAPQVLDLFEDRAAETFLGEGWWNRFTRDNARFLRSTHSLTAPGAHTLKVTMVDPGIVLQKSS